MEIEVVKLSKIEKSTDQGIKDVFAVVLEGDELIGANQIPVHGKLLFSCEVMEPLTKLVNMVIGDKRLLSLKAVNHELGDFAAEPEPEETWRPGEGTQE